MKSLSPEIVRRKNLRALWLCAAAAALILTLFSLPVYRFDTCLYTKKSANTFVGDEKYLSVRAEADAVAESYRAQKGLGEVTVSEETTQRVNSKGAVTSMISFRVGASVTRNAWDFMACALPSGRVLTASAIALGLSALLLAISLPGSLETPPKRLPQSRVRLRRLACALALAALLLAPVFHFATVNVFDRQIIAQMGKQPAPKTAALLAAADAFLYGGQAGDQAAARLAGLTHQPLTALWLVLPAMFLMLTQMILLCSQSPARTLGRGLMYLFVVLLCATILYPYYVMLITAFRENAEATDMYFRHIFPTRWVWSNIPDIVNRGVLRYLLNSLMLSAGATLTALACGIPAAYAMARMDFRGKKAFLGLVIMSQMFAPIVLLVGISQLMSILRLNDSILGLTLINAAFNQAFAIWLLRGTFVSISSEMEQAAAIDGCGTVGALWRVLLPMAAPGIVTTLIFVFINAWNEYTISTVLISTPFKKPITVGITQFSSFNMIEWQYLFAAALLATIPVVILFMFIEKHLVAGLTSGGVKG